MPGSCQGVCGAAPQGGGCYCDGSCFSFDDCCDDVCDVCSGDFAQQCQACDDACLGLECGSDGCGGSCGECVAGDVCGGGTCVSATAGSTCAEPIILTLGQPANQDSSTATDDFFFGLDSCAAMTSAAQPGAPDQVYTFTPPSTGNFTFELKVLGSFYANVFVLGSCEDPAGTTLMCLPDSTIFTKELNVWLQIGVSVTVVVDGDLWFNPGGAYTLTVTEYDPCPWADCSGKACGDDGCDYGAICGVCPGTEVCTLAHACVTAGTGDSCAMPYVLEGDLPIEAVGSTAEPGTTDYFSYGEGLCPGNLDTSEGNDGPDHVWAFSPPASGNYSFEFDSWNSFSGAITYLLGACDAQASQCIGGLPYYDNDPLVAYLSAGETYHFVVDAYDGTFTPTGSYGFTVDEYSPCWSADCEGKVCGDNGCGDGALCGLCPGGDICAAGVCQDPDEGDTCSDPFFVSVSATEPYSANFDNSYAANDYEKDYGVCADWSQATGSEGLDQAFDVTFEEPGSYRITVTPLDSWYVAVYVVDGSCDDLETGCTATDDGDSSSGATVDVEVDAFESLYVIVDGDTTSEWQEQVGPYTFMVEAL
jgi:hypothetical protein